MFIVGGSYFDEDNNYKLKKYKDELIDISGGDFLFFNKRTAGLTSMFEVYLAKLLNINDQKPRIKTKAHQKIQEQNKARAIYQTTFLHYLACAYILMPIEEALKSKFIFMNIDPYENIYRYINRLKTAKNYYVNSFDFEDFNAQHTFEHMKRVFISLTIKVAGNISDPKTNRQYNEIAKWVIESIDNTYTIVEGKVYNWSAGLPSGVRYTSLMNNILNYIYTEIMYDGLANKYTNYNGGIKLYEVCGDDSYHGFRSKLESDAYNLEMKNCGYAIQISKQMTSKTTFEFLRLQYYENGMISGCLNRSISNAVCGNWEGTGSNDFAMILSEAYTSMISMMRRGLYCNMGIKIFEVMITSQILFCCIDQTSDFDTFVRTYDRCQVISKLLGLVRRIKKADGGMDSLLYTEQYLYNGKNSNLISDFNKILKQAKQKIEVEQGFENAVKSKKCTSITRTVQLLNDWMIGTGTIRMVDINYNIVTSNVIKLATAGAVKGNKSSDVAIMVKDDTLYMMSLQIYSKLRLNSSLPKNKATRFMNNIVLFNTTGQWAYWFNNKDKIKALQSAFAVNMNIVKFWMVKDSLSTKDKKKLFKVVFEAKLTKLLESSIDDISFDNKGKMQLNLFSKQTDKLNTIFESEKLGLICYIITRSRLLYRAVILERSKNMIRRLIINN